MARNKNQFSDMLTLKMRTWDYYWERLSNIALSVFEWKNLPDTVDPRFLELSIYRNGMCVFFKDPVMGYLALPCMIGGQFNVYNIPTQRTAYAANGYQMQLDETNSVIIFHNHTHDVPVWDMEMFASRLCDYQRVIDINIHAQKTPVVVMCDDNERYSFVKMMQDYEGDIPLIFANKALNTKDVTTLKIDAPFVADKVEELRTMVWNDAMTYLGISNVNVTKKERLITDEVQRNMGGTLASRYSPLEMRRQAAVEINRMFGLNIGVDFREDLLIYQQDILNESLDEGEEEEDE